MPTLFLVVLALSLPLGGLGRLFMLGRLPLDAPAIATLAALAFFLFESLRRPARPGLAEWSAITWSGAWLASSLAAPVEWIPASISAWELAAGPLIFACARPVLPPRSRNAVLAGLGFAVVAAIVLRFAGGAGLPLPEKYSPVPWAGFPAKPLAGFGPGSYPGLPLWQGLLPRGGLLAGLSGLFLVGALSREIFRNRPGRRPVASPIPPATVLGALILSGFVFNPFTTAGLGMGFWLAMAVLLPPSNGAYNGKRRA